MNNKPTKDEGLVSSDDHEFDHLETWLERHPRVFLAIALLSFFLCLLLGLFVFLQ